MDEKQAQLEWEARAGRGAAIAAFLSTACIVASLAARVSIGEGSTKKAESLRIAHDHESAIMAVTVLNGLSFIMLGLALTYLFRAIKFRKPEFPRIAVYLVILAPVLMLIAGIIGTLEFFDTATKFLASGARTEVRAKQLIDDSGATLGASLGFAGGLGMAVGLVLFGLYGMRAGLVSRFMGVIGMAIGGLIVLPILPGPVLQLFWGTALGVLFLGYWPGGRGPAWETGEAIEWPSQAQRMAAERDDDDDDELEDEPEPAEPLEPAPQRNPNARSRKRKKKKSRR